MSALAAAFLIFMLASFCAVGLFAVGCGVLYAFYEVEEIRRDGWQAWWMKGTNWTGPK